MGNNEITKCYACDTPATTQEHVPPKCFFPDNQRIELITVPSCSIHNHDKSSDDEYVACFLAMNAENSAVAINLFQGPRLRSMMRREGRLGKRIFSKAWPALNKTGQKTLRINYEISRVNGVLEHIAQAIYFKHTGGKRCSKGFTIHSPRLYIDSGWPNKIQKQLRCVADGFDELSKRGDMRVVTYGSNPKIFWCQILETSLETPQIRIMFYETFEFFAFTNSYQHPQNQIEP